MKEEHRLQQYNFKEVFITCDDEDEEFPQFFVDISYYDLIDRLKSFTPALNPKVRIFHGCLSAAKLIPKSFKGKSAFIVYQDPNYLENGNVLDTSPESPEKFAKQITKIVASKKVTIDNIYILYGYQIEVCLSIMDDDIDEEIISVCENIIDDIKSMSNCIKEREVRSDFEIQTS